MAAVAADGDDDFARGYCYYCCLDREWEEDTVVLLVCWFFVVKGNLESPLPVEGIAIQVEWPKYVYQEEPKGMDDTRYSMIHNNYYI